jgi:hypothetical protein
VEPVATKIEPETDKFFNKKEVFELSSRHLKKIID